MTIVISGGGTAGHITPALAVAHELVRLRPEARLVFIGQRKDRFAELIQGNTALHERWAIFAGKYRRYHGQSWLTRLLDVPTFLKNLRDVAYVGLGLLQSLYLLRRIKPDVVFLKGGFVCVPVGLAAAFWKIPLVTHDSDSLPGLANRIVARWATMHAVGMPKEFYQYNPAHTVFVGVPVAADFTAVDNAMQAAYREDLQLPADALVLTVTGGSQGAQRLNDAIFQAGQPLLTTFKNLHVLLVAGSANEKAEQTRYAKLPAKSRQRVRVVGYTSGLYKYTGAADVVLTRAGATSVAELAIQGKACVVVPNPHLTGGHQLKNARELAAAATVTVVQEAAIQQDPDALRRALEELLANPERRLALAARLQALAKPAAAAELAELLLRVASERGKKGAR